MGDECDHDMTRHINKSSYNVWLLKNYLWNEKQSCAFDLAAKLYGSFYWREWPF